MTGRVGWVHIPNVENKDQLIFVANTVDSYSSSESCTILLKAVVALFTNIIAHASAFMVYTKR
jgi:hypothetical protein